ncbi:hypothetical protein QR680_016374 [Steinernema hermaphroditum]|uniref:C2H2-type domain-containing protein n=1 Tax=Steinernema hermaphroditum TaxID=289476 RepID=A0AA39LM90_9BILA|nr:hypothetical protein QR680_016374 [Steinernema hermaphroditum]
MTKIQYDSIGVDHGGVGCWAFFSNKSNAILPSTEVEDLVLKEFSQVLLAKIVFDRNFAVLFYKSEEHLDSEIMEAIVAHLPSNKRPGLVCHVDDWPVTKNGKVDDEALLPEARKQIQLESSDSVKSIFKEYGVSLEEDKEETFQNLGFTSLQATELLFKLAPLIEEEMVGEMHRLPLSDEGKVVDLLKVLDYGSLKDSERKASVSDLQLVEEVGEVQYRGNLDLARNKQEKKKEKGIMVPPSTPSSVRPLDVDAVVYNFVKRTKPELLLEMFGKNRCHQLEQGDHRFDRSSFLSALEKVREDSKEEKCEAAETSERKEPSNSSSSCGYCLESLLRTVSERSKVKITPELAVFDYFYERQNSEALKLLFNKEIRKDYGRKVDRMGIHMPSVLRMYAYHRRLHLKHENKECIEIWKCQMCKKEYRGIGVQILNHIGVHERIPVPCIIEGCEKVVYCPGSLFGHLKRTHVRYVEHLSAQQYCQYTKSQKSFYEQAKKVRDKYFPPESFIRFNDTKVTCTSRDFEDPKCRECGQIMKTSASRRTHIAHHLNLRYKCLFDGCSSQLVASSMTAHLNTVHKKKVAELSEQQIFAHKQMMLVFHKIMKEAVPKYFPYKTGANKEDLQN